ncbi:MAG: hypothetical protein JNM56_05690 [Planctomycetia bacterium]|nr:hypothetical protein [Planctomycetia bacterium]
MALCHYHPERAGVGICMRCRVVICTACCTKLDGVNHCHACLKALGRRDEPARSHGIPAALAAVLVLGLCWLLFFAGSWLLQVQLAKLTAGNP